MTRNPKLVMKLSKNSPFYDFPKNLQSLGSQENFFNYFGPQSFDLGMGQK